MTTAPVVSVTDELLAELEEAAKAATPGPWGWDGPVWAYDPAEEAPWLIAEDTGDPIVHGEIECNERNALFLSLSHPATVLALIARIRELERDAGRYRWWRMFFETDSADMPNAVCEARTPNELDAAIDAALNPTNGTTNPHQNG